MPDEEDQLPILFVLATPAWHAGKANTVLDDVEDFSVRQILRPPLAHVGGRRVKTGINLGFPAPVVGVADGTVVGKVVPGFGNI